MSDKCVCDHDVENCGAVNIAKNGFECTRENGHAGNHVACGAGHYYCEWSNENERNEMDLPKELDFFHAFTTKQKEVHETAKEKGWWDEDRNDGEMIALMHSELSEGLEALRKNVHKSEHISSFLGIEEELADVVIRIMDYAEARCYDIAGAIIAKCEFNKTRERKHGKNF